MAAALVALGLEELSVADPIACRPRAAPREGGIRAAGEVSRRLSRELDDVVERALNGDYA